MAFKEIRDKIKVPLGATERFKTLEALERMLRGTFYDDIPYAFEQEKRDGNHIPMRDRRPSVDFNLPYEITSETQAELFGDEQFPIIRCRVNGNQNDDAGDVYSELLEATNLPQVVSDAYEDGVIGSVAVVVHRSDDGTPFYDVLPAKWCEPVYRSKVSSELIMLAVTYPISRSEVEEKWPEIAKDERNKGCDTFWYRYVVGPVEIVEYLPLSDDDFDNLGGHDVNGILIEFVEDKRLPHGFAPMTPVAWAKNLGANRREIDGTCLWWPVRNPIVEIDYTLSQCGRGLRYAADPMLFIKQGELMDQNSTPLGMQKPAGGMATNIARDGTMVKGVTQTLVGGPNSDAKILEINAAGIAEEREFVKDLREYVLEVLGGMKARSENVKGASSGRAIDRQGKPLRRLVRRQRRPYGNDLLLRLVDITLHGMRVGALDVDVDFRKIPEASKPILEWPNDEILQGSELLADVQGKQLSCGGSMMQPLQLIDPKVIGAKLAGDMGIHQPFPAIEGTGEPVPAPPGENAPPGGGTDT